MLRSRIHSFYTYAIHLLSANNDFSKINHGFLMNRLRYLNNHISNNIFLLYLCLLGIVFQADRTSYVILSVIVLQQAAGVSSQ